MCLCEGVGSPGTRATRQLCAATWVLGLQEDQPVLFTDEPSVLLNLTHSGVIFWTCMLWLIYNIQVGRKNFSLLFHEFVVVTTDNTLKKKSLVPSRGHCPGFCPDSALHAPGPPCETAQQEAWTQGSIFNEHVCLTFLILLTTSKVILRQGLAVHPRQVLNSQQCQFLEWRSFFGSGEDWISCI